MCCLRYYFRRSAFLWQGVSTKPQVFYFSGARIFRDWEVQTVLPLHRDVIRTGIQLINRHGVSIRDLMGPLLILPFLCWSPFWFSDRLRWQQLILLVFVYALLAFGMLKADYSLRGRQ